MAFVFPNRRTGLFFQKYLSEVADTPLFSPTILTINDLFIQLSGKQSADRISMLFTLYDIYIRQSGSTETFDEFLYWGEMLLNDFDDIDKYMANARMLFSNVTDLREIENDFDFLSDEQIAAIRSFWSSFYPRGDTPNQQQFLAVWQVLYDLYEEFRATLAAEGKGYEGMIFREVVESMERGESPDLPYEQIVFVGLNALSVSEERFLAQLQKRKIADFYWDYVSDKVTDPDNKASYFVSRNRKSFPSSMKLPPEEKVKTEIEVIGIPSGIGQAKHVYTLLSDWCKEAEMSSEEALRTAVILPDEHLLIPVLNAIPEQIRRINVTMGYPLRSSLAYTFVERLVELQAHRRTKGAGCTFYHADAVGILAHPYVADSDARETRAMQDEIVRERRISVDAAWLGRNDLLRMIFSPAAAWRELSDWLLRVVAAVARTPYEGDDRRQRVEFLAVISEEISKLRNSLDECDIELTTEVYTSLLRRHLQTVRIPYEGEPLEGVQVMGILETRNLDFENVVLLSMNDDNFPGNHMAQASFVPYNLRAAYGLPTPEHHEGVYAYYFYRLVQRARRVWMLYCSHADDKSTGEPSRYIYQLDYESGFPVRKVEVGVDVNLAETDPIEVAKDEGIMQRLGRFTDPESKATLSPTAFFRYVACPLRFYFHSVARLQADDEIAEEVDAPMFGTILHAAVQKLYARIVGEAHPGETLRAMIRTGEIAAAVEAAINENYLQDPAATTDDYTGNLLLVKDIVTRYLRGGVMPYDAAHDGFTVTGLEQEVAYGFDFTAAGRPLCMKFAGIADRIDALDDGTLRVVDYKTGAPHLEFAGVESLFRGEGKQRLSNILQTLLYAMMLYRTRGVDAEPALYYVRAMNRPDYLPTLDDRETGVRGGRYTLYAERFEELVRQTLAELYDPSVPFRQCEDADTCKFCDFNVICKR